MHSYKRILITNRDSIGYHTAINHYGVNFGDGNMFERAKNMAKNDKDIVFALNPQPFIYTGVDTEKVDGWAFAEVETMDAKGNTISVPKFLKPFEIK